MPEKSNKNIPSSVNAPIIFTLPDGSKSDLFLSTTEALKWFNKNYGELYNIVQPAEENSNNQLLEVVVTAKRSTSPLFQDVFGSGNPIWGSDRVKGVRRAWKRNPLYMQSMANAQAVGAAVALSPFAVLAASEYAIPWLTENILPYLTAKGWLAATQAAGNTPVWLTPTTATAIDATLAGIGTGASVNDMVLNGPSVGNVAGTVLGLGGLAYEAAPTIMEGYNTVRNIIRPSKLTIAEKAGFPKGDRKNRTFIDYTGSYSTLILKSLFLNINKESRYPQYKELETSLDNYANNFYNNILYPLFVKNGIDSRYPLFGWDNRGIQVVKNAGEGRGGFHGTYSGENIVQAIDDQDFMYSAGIHEAASHSTDKFIPEDIMHKYNDLLDFLKFQGGSRSFKVKDADNWYEIRATMNLVKDKLKLYFEYKPNGTIDITEQSLAKIPDEELLKAINDSSSYGRDYVRMYNELHPEDKNRFLKLVKDILVYPSLVGIVIKLNNNEKD